MGMARKEVSEQEKNGKEGVRGWGAGRERLSECRSFLSLSSSLPLFSIESDSIL